ncbi:MAG: DUF1071 domain-containing protein [Muribaculaceae bacterium]|nr:DUF1071 domain-containing protein [Muribaculaceae bacterium]
MSNEDFSPIDFLNNENLEQQTIKTREDNVAEKFNQLVSLNVNEKTESKNGLSYLSWSNAWLEFKKVYPTATYNVVKNTLTGLPYFVDPNIGIMVFTEVTADNQTYSMWLPVMDSSNKAMKIQPYTYQVWNKTTRQYENRNVEAATMFDINKAIMRCLTKNLAMFGLGLYLYNGEDMPETLESSEATEDVQQASTTKQPKVRKQRKASADRYDGIRQAINATQSTQELNALYRQHENEVKNNPRILALFTERKEQLINAA